MAVESLQWFQMTPEQREAYIQKVFDTQDCRPKRPYLADVEREIPNVSKAHMKDIWANAAMILDTEKIIGLENDTFCITDSDDSFIVKKSGQLYQCECPMFKANSVLCQHVVVVCENSDSLQQYLTRLEKQTDKAVKVMFRDLPGGSGRKPGAKNAEVVITLQNNPFLIFRKTALSIHDHRSSPSTTTMMRNLKLCSLRITRMPSNVLPARMPFLGSS